MACRSDSDSEGENPEKKKLQEQLMGMSIIILGGIFCCTGNCCTGKCPNNLFKLMFYVALSLWVHLFSIGSNTYRYPFGSITYSIGNRKLPMFALLKEECRIIEKDSYVDDILHITQLY